MVDLPKGKKIILFDGVCNLCNNFVNMIIKKDKNNSFVFTALESNHGQKITNHLKNFIMQRKKLQIMVLYQNSLDHFIDI